MASEPSRRTILGAAGLGVVTVTVAACSGTKTGSATAESVTATNATTSGAVSLAPPTTGAASSIHPEASHATAPAPHGSTHDAATTEHSTATPDKAAPGQPSPHEATTTHEAAPPAPAKSSSSAVAARPNDAIVSLSAVPVGGSTLQNVNGKPVVLSQPNSGSVAGFSAICTHMGCTVGTGGSVLHCPCHGSAFNAFTGAVVNGPAARPLPAVPVKVENGWVVPA